ncbi:MAG TPA: hypothetical protein VF179_01975 [Thermoanaerobaculia bacterium]|nr:hypothetical protein [Thermoanaerobaculia bacterium]
MSSQPPFSEVPLEPFEITVGVLALVLLLAWPFGAHWLSHRVLSTQRRVSFVPLVAASVSILFLAIPLLFRQIDVVRLSTVLLCTSGAAATGSCLVVLGLATAGLPTSTRLLAMLLLFELLYFSVVPLTLIPFRVTPGGWWVEPSSLFSWVPFIAAFAAPAFLIRRTRAALP